MSNRITVTAHEGIAEPSWIGRVGPFAEKILNHLDIDQWELSVMFCDDAFIAGLNMEYRKIEGPTDVLSFEQGDEYIDDQDLTWFNAGDIVISLDSLASNARSFGVGMNEETKRLLVHGILHLDGMDHESNSPDEEMLQMQERILSAFKSDIVFEG